MKPCAKLSASKKTKGYPPRNPRNPENLVPLENPEPLAPTLLELDLETGYEAYLITPLPLLEAKRIAVTIEDTHPLGRLFDIDVINTDGIPVARNDIGEKPRRCLVCEHEARYCMRMRWHTQEEIWAKINEMVDLYTKARQT